MQLVIVDLDGTLLHGPTSSEKLFFRYLLEQKMIGLTQLWFWCYFFLRWFPVYGFMTAKKNKAYLAGLQAAQVAKIAATFVQVRLVERYNSEMVRRIRIHQESGDVIVLVTGSLAEIARGVCRSLDIRHMRASLCAQKAGAYIPSPLRLHPFGREKLRLCRELGQKLGYDLSQATAYGNDRHDLVLLEAVRTPVAVKPDRILHRHAVQSAWEIIERG